MDSWPQRLKCVQDLVMPNRDSYWYGMSCTLVKNSTRGRNVSLNVHREYMTTAAFKIRMRKWTSIGNDAWWGRGMTTIKSPCGIEENRTHRLQQLYKVYGYFMKKQIIKICLRVGRVFYNFFLGKLCPDTGSRFLFPYRLLAFGWTTSSESI